MAGDGEMGFGRLLKHYRRQARLTQELLAERAGYSPNYISMLERGVRVPALTTVDVLAQALQLEVADRALLETALQQNGIGQVEQVSTPRNMAGLIGREQDTDQIIQFLRSNVRLLTLTGPGGIGKTRLAEYVAGKMRPNLANGAILVDLTLATDPEHVISGIARALQIRDQGHRLLGEDVLAILHEKEMLLVLDSMQHALIG